MPFFKTLDFDKPLEFASNIGLSINLYPEILLLLKRGYLQIEGNKIIMQNSEGKQNLFRFRKKNKYLDMITSEEGNYTTYFPRIYERHKLFEKTAEQNKVQSNYPSLIFISNQYPADKYGHTNITILTNNKDHKETTDINLTKKNPSLFKYVETVFTPSEALIAGNVFAGHEGGTGITQALGFEYSNSIVANHLKMDAFIDAIVQKTPEMKRSYNALSAPVYRGFNCTRYALHALSEVGIELDELVGANRFTFSPGQLGRKISKFIDSNHKELDFEVYLKNPDGSAVNNKPISFFRSKAEGNKHIIYVDGGDSKDKLIKLDENSVVNPNLNYILWKIYNNECEKSGKVIVINADEELDKKHAVSLNINKPIKTPYQLELGNLKLDSASVEPLVVEAVSNNLIKN